MGWLVLCVSLILELTLMEQLLSALELVTMAEEIKKAGWSAPPGQSQTTCIHIFLGKPNTTVTPKFTWVSVYNSTRWSEEEDQILVNKPNSVTFISWPKQQCLHPCLWQDEGVLIGNLEVCAWSLKWKDGERMFSTEFKGQDGTAAQFHVLVSHVCHALQCQSQMSKGPVTGGC